MDNTELKNQDLHYAVYNISGQKMSEGMLNASERQNIDVSFLNGGVYIINVSNGKQTFSNKFIKIND